MKQGMASKERSNVRPNLSCWLWLVGILLVLHLLIMEARGAHSAEPLTRIAFGSCANQSAPQMVGRERTVGPFKNIPRFWAVSPEELKLKYDLLKHGQPGYVALRKKTQIVGTWDDHDYGLNDAGKEYEGKDASQQLMLDFLDEAPDSQRRKQQGVYAAYTYGPVGKKVKVILLDTRYHRDPLRSDGTMLGETQWRWFEHELQNSDAQIHIIGSSIQTSGVLFISGDVHFGEISRFDCGLTYPVYDITSSGLTEAVEEKYAFPFSIALALGGWVLPQTMRVHNSRCTTNTCVYGHANFGTFEIDWDANPVIIDANVRDIHGNPVLGETIKLSELQPGYFKSQAVRGRHVKRHCTLESELPWYRKYILAITFIGTLTVSVGTLLMLLVLIAVRLTRRTVRSLTFKED